MSYKAVRLLYLRSVGLIFLVAFASLYAQLPGLYGKDGLEPVRVFLARRAAFPSRVANFLRLPTLLWFYDIPGLDLDTALDLVALSGAAAAGAVAAGAVSPWALGAAWLAYLSLFNVGQTFLSFQWDILLLETGWAALWLALRTKGDAGQEPALAALLLQRWVLFKLMFCSGAVKIQARCPTWLRLTACHYHAATQCLPTPLAWYFHQLPGTLLKLAVAAAFVIELPATALILASWRPLRVIGAALQAFLQANIIATGNYNFFNLLTIALCVPLLDDAGAAEGDFERLTGVADGPGAPPARALWRRGVWLLCVAAGLSPVVYASVRMFAVVPDETERSGRRLQLAMTPDAFQAWLAAWLSWITGVWGAAMLAAWALDVWQALRPAVQCLLPARAAARTGSAKHGQASRAMAWWRVAGALAAGAGVAATFAIGARDLLALDASADAHYMAVPLARHAYQRAWRYHISSRYGLFRQMTGIGDSGEGRVVARPELDFQGSKDGVTWQSYIFRYKPGAPERAPPWVAPHQPRLDWQMWFAALGTPEQNPWCVHLAWRLLTGSAAAGRLLDDASPWRAAPPRHVRVMRWNMDFTRAAWGRQRRGPHDTELPVADAASSLWWSRQPTGQWMMALEANSSALNAFLAPHGWGPELARCPRQLFICECCQLGASHLGCEERAMGRKLSVTTDAYAWFCSKECDTVYQQMAALEGQRTALNENYSIEIAARHHKLCKGSGTVDTAFCMLQGAFDIKMDSGEDLLDLVCHSEETEDNDDQDEAAQLYNYSTFRVVVLRKGPSVVTAATLRVFGRAFAELPFVATKVGYRREGNLRRFMNALQALLRLLKVEHLVLPSLPQLRPMWMQRFGFTPLTIAEAAAVEQHVITLDSTSASLLKKPLLHVPMPAINLAMEDLRLGSGADAAAAAVSTPACPADQPAAASPATTSTDAPPAVHKKPASRMRSRLPSGPKPTPVPDSISAAAAVPAAKVRKRPPRAPPRHAQQPCTSALRATDAGAPAPPTPEALEMRLDIAVANALAEGISKYVDASAADALEAAKQAKEDLSRARLDALLNGGAMPPPCAPCSLTCRRCWMVRRAL
ncbi:hypothetical protein WJX81_004903 [Elliptochloris bilobata]|uniref:Lipase maturation factor 2 n=1 Tax=Elliptochloris bilobata TaxID=381761 RepID=A0AAW1RCS1_9CHLO